jgi:hypothetical protein
MPEVLMRIFRFGSGALIWILLAVVVTAQQLSTQTPQTAQAIPILQRSLGVLVGRTAINDATLTGTARRVAGSDDETGTAVLKALATGEARMDVGFPSGPLSEVWVNSVNGQSGRWTGPDGKTHAMSQHNLLTDSSWFFPPLTLSKWLSTPGYAISLVGQESRNGVTVEHLTVSLLASALPADLSATFQHLSQSEIYLDSASGLPVALAFNIHPDNNLLLDLPVEIRLSDYRNVNGIQVPFHVQKYLNNSLILDIQLQTATVNSGLTASAFAIQ